MEHLEEIRKIVNEYSRIEGRMAILIEETKALALKKQEIELDLARVKEEELNLIDKIKRQTGKSPDFFEIMQELNLNPERKQ